MSMDCSVEKGCWHYLVHFLKSKEASVFCAHLGLITHPHYLSVPVEVETWCPSPASTFLVARPGIQVRYAR